MNVEQIVSWHNYKFHTNMQLTYDNVYIGGQCYIKLLILYKLVMTYNYATSNEYCMCCL